MTGLLHTVPDRLKTQAPVRRLFSWLEDLPTLAPC